MSLYQVVFEGGGEVYVETTEGFEHAAQLAQLHSGYGGERPTAVHLIDEDDVIRAADATGMDPAIEHAERALAARDRCLP